MKATSMEDPEQEDQIKGNGWLRKHDEPQFAGLGEYTAWIVGTKQSPSPGSAGVSCAGWFVRKNDDSELPVRHARTSDTSDSDEQRAGIAAVLRCLETLPRQANIRISTRAEWISDGINGGMEQWQREDWKKTTKTKRNGWEIWEQVIKIRNDEGITLSAEHRAKDDTTFDRLRNWARVMSKKKSDELGVQKGDHIAHRKGRRRTSSPDDN